MNIFKIIISRESMESIEVPSSYNILTDAKENLLSDLKDFETKKGDKIQLIRLANNEIEYEIVIP